MTPISVQRSPAEAGGGKAPAIARAAAALRLLGRSAAPLGLSAVARELALPPSSCLYVLRALVAEELVAFDPATKRYALEAGVLTLARRWLGQNPFPALAQPALDALARRFEVTMLGVQTVGLDHVIVLAAAAAGSRFQLGVAVGSRFPALISATGRCVAAFGDHPAAEIRRRFRLLRWDRPPPLDVWLAQVERTRAAGYGLDEGNYMAGVTVVAAPAWRRAAAAPSHALVAVGTAGAIAPVLDALAAAMREAAAGLSVSDGAFPR